MRGLWRVRVRLSRAGPSGGLRHERWGDPLEGQSDHHEETQEASGVMKGSGFGIRDSGSGIRGSAFGAFLLAAVAVLNLACKSKTAPTAGGLFPASGEVTGWVKSGETRTFEADRLWEYIDGDADRYIQAGVEQTLTADYRYQNRADAVADVHILKTPDGPRKLMEAESSADSRPASVGDNARLYASSLVFRKGRYLVRVVAYDETPEISKALVDLGQAIGRRL
jgi:hypothetical protein